MRWIHVKTENYKMSKQWHDLYIFVVDMLAAGCLWLVSDNVSAKPQMWESSVFGVWPSTTKLLTFKFQGVALPVSYLAGGMFCP